MNLIVTPRLAARFYTTAALLTFLASVLGILTRYTSDPARFGWYLGMFDLNGEQNLPTYWQGIALLLCSGLLLVITAHARGVRDRNWIAWAGLAVLFAALSFDEMCSIHEQFANWMHRRRPQLTENAFDVGWTIAAVVGFIAIGFAYLRFLLHLPLRTRIRFIVAGALFMGSAVLVDLVGTSIGERLGTDTLMYRILGNLEEIGEMTGVGLFGVSLISHLAERVGQITITISAGQATAGQRDSANADSDDRPFPAISAGSQARPRRRVA